MSPDMPSMLQGLFQFLIGRLETACSRVFYAPARQFQFLIGRLETNIYRFGIFAESKFQFLIGRLETVFIWLRGLDFPCFNSSQVGWKQWHQNGTFLRVPCFNSSQVGWKQMPRLRLPPTMPVSIPHRQAGNRLLSRIRATYREFQFLIGRLETPLGPESSAGIFGFNSSQVGWKQHQIVSSRDENRLFQFLIGRLETNKRSR